MNLYFDEFLFMAGFIQINLFESFSQNSEALTHNLSFNHHFKFFSQYFFKYFIQTHLLSCFIGLLYRNYLLLLFMIIKLTSEQTVNFQFLCQIKLLDFLYQNLLLQFFGCSIKYSCQVYYEKYQADLFADLFYYLKCFYQVGFLTELCLYIRCLIICILDSFTIIYIIYNAFAYSTTLLLPLHYPKP